MFKGIRQYDAQLTAPLSQIKVLGGIDEFGFNMRRRSNLKKRKKPIFFISDLWRICLVILISVIFFYGLAVIKGVVLFEGQPVIKSENMPAIEILAFYLFLIFLSLPLVIFPPNKKTKKLSLLRRVLMMIGGIVCWLITCIFYGFISKHFDAFASLFMLLFLGGLGLILGAISGSVTIMVSKSKRVH